MTASFNAVFLSRSFRVMDSLAAVVLSGLALLLTWP